MVTTMYILKKNACYLFYGCNSSGHVLNFALCGCQEFAVKCFILMVALIVHIFLLCHDV